MHNSSSSTVEFRNEALEAKKTKHVNLFLVNVHRDLWSLNSSSCMC